MGGMSINNKTPLATVTPLSAQQTGSVGTSLKAAKEDHVHPLVHSYVECDTQNGYGAVATCIRRWLNRVVVGTDISVTDNANDGTYFTINTAGIYAISSSDGMAGADYMGASVNATGVALSTAIQSINAVNRLYCDTSSGANIAGSGSIVRSFNAGDIVRSHNTTTAGTGAIPFGKMRIERVG